MLLTFILALGAVSAAGVSRNAGPDLDCLDVDACNHARAAMMRGSPGGSGGEGEGSLAESLSDTDLLHYWLDLEILPDATSLSGSNTMTLRSRIDGLTTFTFRLHSQLTITAVEVNAAPAAWQRLDSAAVQVTLDRAYNTGEQFDVRVVYNGVPPDLGYGSIVFTTHSGTQPLIYTLSETWFAYTWWPVKEDNTDKATGDMWFTVPDTLTVASNGLLQGVDALGGSRKRFRWATQYPTATYLFSFSAANYNKYVSTYNFGSGTMPMEIYLFPEEDTDGHRNSWFRSLTMMDAFRGRYGLYPFTDEKYGIYRFGFGGGQEHQTMTGLGVYTEWIVAHELSHQWWGDNVTCATWHDIWLNEGFATYSEAIWYETKPGSPGLPALFDWMAQRRPSNVNGSVYVYDDTNFGRIFNQNFTYLKGGWVLHMLRHVMGDARFFQTLAEYRAAYEHGSATTADFQAVAESVYGASLDWFFEEWVYDVGAPAYEYAWRPISAAGRNYVELYVGQTQTASYPRFTMPIDILISGPAQDTTQVVWNDAPAEHLLFETPGAASNAAFDPNKWILWTAANSTAFPEGPPKIVAVSPTPGRSVSAAEAESIKVVFHKSVVIGASDVVLTGDHVGAVPTSVSFDASANRATIRPQTELPPDVYTLTVKDTVVDAAAHKQLDGELRSPTDPGALPSGDGLPGGNFVVRFTVNSCQPCDANCDGSVNQFDIVPFVEAIVAHSGCSSCSGDANGDGSINQLDVQAFVECLGG